jgi:hypothetical protein
MESASGAPSLVAVPKKCDEGVGDVNPDPPAPTNNPLDEGSSMILPTEAQQSDAVLNESVTPGVKVCTSIRFLDSHTYLMLSMILTYRATPCESNCFKRATMSWWKRNDFRHQTKICTTKGFELNSLMIAFPTRSRPVLFTRHRLTLIWPTLVSPILV